MPCKTYREIFKELEPYLEGENIDAVDKAIKSAREASYTERVDAYEANKLWAIDMLKRLQPKIGNMKIDILDVRRGKDGLEFTFKYPSGTVVTTGFDGNIPISFKGADGIQYNGWDILQLFSDREFVNEGIADYKERAVDYVNHPEQMNEFAEELARLDTITSEHKTRLLAAVRQLSGPLAKFLPKVRLFIKEQAAKTGGWADFNAKDVDVYLSVGPTNEHKSALEVYAHEMYHTVTKFAIDSRDAKLANTIRQIVGIKNQLLSNVSAFELAKYMNNDVEGARKILDYIADPKVGLHEFVAHAMTNEAVIKALENLAVEETVEEHPNLFSKLVAYVRELFNGLVEFMDKKPDGNAYQQMQVLVTRLAQANNRQLEVKRNKVLEKLFSAFVKTDTRLARYLKATADKIAKSPMPVLKSASKKDIAIFMFKMAARSLVDSNTKKAFEYYSGQMLTMFKPERSFMTILRDMSQSDTFQDTIEKLGLVSQNIDQKREMIFTSVAKTLKDGFSRKLTDAEMTAITNVLLDTDMQCIAGDVDIFEALTNDKYVKEKIDEISKELRDAVADADWNYYDKQTDGLAYFMITGKGGIGQLQNAYNISRKLTAADRKSEDVDERIVTLIDQLATYKSLQYLDKTEKATVAHLADVEEQGIGTILAYASSHEQQARKTTMSKETDRYKMVKGYVKDVYDRDVNFIQAPAVDEQELKGLGYKKVRDLNRHPKDRNSTQMALYISTINATQALHRVSLRYTDTTHRGTTISESYAMSNDSIAVQAAKRDIANMRLMAMNIADDMNSGKYRAYGEDFGLMPLFDNNGEIIDFRYMMDKETKIDVLKADRRAINVLARMHASLYDKEVSEELNKQLLEIVAKDVLVNTPDKAGIGKNNKEYITIKKYAGEPEARDIWRVLPENIKQLYPDGIVVRRDMMHSVFGFRDFSIADLKFVKDMPATFRYSLRVAEYMWKEIVKIAKINIILKIPSVLIGNIVSNFMYSVGSGMNPITVAKLQMEGVRELNDFLAKSREKITLDKKIAAGLGTEMDKRRVSALTNDLEQSTVKKLVDEGFYSTIIEDVSVDEFRAQSRVEKFVDDKLSGYPEFVQDGVHLLFMTEKTKMYKFMNMATQYSDFVARYAQYHLMMDKGVDEQTAVKTIRDVFINYNKPNSRMVEYLNQIGMVMFTKYFTRIQKAIHNEIKTRPLVALLDIFAVHAILGHVDDIYNQALWSKNYSNIFHDPIENLLQAIVPAGFNAADYLYNKVK